MKSNYRWRRQAVPALIVAVAALGLSACGSGSGGSGAAKTSAKTTTTSSATSPARGAFAAGRGKLAACLKAHGVTLAARPRNAPRPGGSGSGAGGPFGGGRGGGFLGGGAAGNSKAAKAFRACAASAGLGRVPGGGAGRFTPRFSTATLVSFAKCVKKNGFTLPAPNTSGKGPIFPTRIEKNAKFVAASKSCESILRSGFPNRPLPGAGGAPPGSGPSA